GAGTCALSGARGRRRAVRRTRAGARADQKWKRERKRAIPSEPAVLQHAGMFSKQRAKLCTSLISRYLPERATSVPGRVPNPRQSRHGTAPADARVHLSASFGRAILSVRRNRGFAARAILT